MMKATMDVRHIHETQEPSPLNLKFNSGFIVNFIQAISIAVRVSATSQTIFLLPLFKQKD